MNYDLLTVPQNKLEAVAAYEQYLKVCREAPDDEECQRLVAGLKRDNERHIELLRSQLEHIVREGKPHLNERVLNRYLRALGAVRNIWRNTRRDSYP